MPPVSIKGVVGIDAVGRQQLKRELIGAAARAADGDALALELEQLVAAAQARHHDRRPTSGS
jgi:hypothetical protein